MKGSLRRRKLSYVIADLHCRFAKYNPGLTTLKTMRSKLQNWQRETDNASSAGYTSILILRRNAKAQRYNYSYSPECGRYRAAIEGFFETANFPNRISRVA